MACILHIETATQVCSVALAVDGSVQQLQESREKNVHSAKITLFIDDVMNKSGLAFAELDAVAVSMGPGSYTGLRIGVSTAKGICFATGKPLIAISTLQAMAAGIVSPNKWNTEHGTRNMEHEPGTRNPEPGTLFLFCPMIDARRMEVYNALFDKDLKIVREIRAEIIDENSFAEELANYRVLFFGDGAEKCKPVLGNRPNARFIDGFYPSAAFMAGLAEQKFLKSEFEDVAYFEPFYLKDFIPGIPKVKGLK